MLNKITKRKFIDAVLLRSGCICPGDTLSYECTVTGGGGTVWAGSAFNCYQYGNEIVLFNSHFDTGTYGMCNNGAIVGRSLSVDGNNYTSQLNVTITPDTAGKTIKCVHDRGAHEILIFTSIIPG